MRPGDIITVTWLDSIHNAGWQQVDSAIKPSMVMRSVGYFIGEDEDRYIISTSIAPGGECLSPLHIPKGAVKKVAGHRLRH